MNKSKENKIDKRIFKNFIIIMIIVLYAILKYVAYNIYNPYSLTDKEGYQKFMDSFVINDTLTINHKVTNSNYIEFKNIKFRNDFTDYETIKDDDDSTLKYALYDENGKIKSYFWVVKRNTYTWQLQDEIDILDLYNNFDKNSHILKSVIRKNNITTDVELVKYLQEHKDDKTTMFSLISTMKKNYYAHALMIQMFPMLDHISLINGDYNGYVLYTNNGMKEVNIEKGNDKYSFVFSNDDKFTDEYISDLLGTLIIK